MNNLNIIFFIYFLFIYYYVNCLESTGKNENSNRSSYCTPPKIENGDYRIYSKNYTVGDQIPNYASVIVTCNKNYGLYPPGNKYIVCLYGVWKRTVPRCVRTCSALKSASVEFDCKLDNYPQNCFNDMVENTIVRMSCKPHYYTPYNISTNTITVCQNGKWNQPVLTCNPECGLKYSSLLEPFIVNGHRTEHGKFPWHVGIYRKPSQSNLYNYLCGGSIITTTIILSAAHCFTYNENGKVADISEFQICANKYYSDFNSNLDNYVQKRQVSKIEIPAGYKGEISVFARDIAVVVLSLPFVLTNHVKPICVDWKSLFEKEQLVHKNNGEVAGWGYTLNTTYSKDEALNTLTVPFIDTSQCIDSVPNNFIKYITPDKFCGGYTNGSSVCNGDSGGGLVFQRMENRKLIYYIRGIVSLGPVKEGYCDQFQYSIYTKVSYYLDFIKDIVSLNKDISPEDCIYPNITNGKFVISGHEFKIGDHISTNTTGIFECDEQYELYPYIRSSTCKDGNWSTTIPACIRSNDCQVKYNNKPGQCTLLKNCPEALTELKLGKRPHLCGLEGTEPVVCCSKMNSISENSQQISRKKCEEYSARVYNGISDANNITKCSLNTELLIDDIPSAAHLALIGFDHKGIIQWRCNGVLISDQFVLSPASCCFDKPFNPAEVVRLGDFVINSTPNVSFTQDFKILDVILHPALNSTQQYNDIALLKLDRKVDFNENVRPACLPVLNYIRNNNEYLLSGWESDNMSSNKSHLIHSKDTKFISYDECSEKISLYRQFKKGIDSDTQFCLNDTEDICQMVRGAILQSYDKDVYCMYNINGLFSFGESSCLSEPNVFAKISPYIDWIESIVWP